MTELESAIRVKSAMRERHEERHDGQVFHHHISHANLTTLMNAGALQQ
jgi:hypothetical protein